MSKKEFLSLFNEKYGEKVVKNLLDDKTFTLIPQNIKPYESDPDGREAVVEQMSQLASFIDELKPLYNKFYKFSFDFPGWIGTLDKKEIMIVGLEPHIEDYYYQICYGFSGIDRFRIVPANGKNDFRIRTIKPGNGNNKKYNTNRLLDIMFRLFSNHIYKINHEIAANDNLKKILEKFYITDLFHFAPRGKASIINKLGNKWHRIRYEVSNSFLEKEICLINPKVIIAQGIASMNILKNIFINIVIKKVASDETFQNLPCKGKFNVNRKEIDILFIPHTSQMNVRFWNANNIKYLHEEISQLLNL
jgi:hypothetical protein